MKKQKSNSKKSSKGLQLTFYKTDIAWAAVIALVFATCLELFYRMIVDYHGKYESDMHYYAVTNVTSGEPHNRLLGVLFQAMYDVSESTVAINVYLALVVAAIVVVNYLVIRYYLAKDGYLGKVPRPVMQFFSVAALFIGPIYVPIVHEWYYRKSFQTWAWHSPTQQSMTLYALIASLCFLMMYIDYEKNGVRPRWWIASALTTLLATTAKPSFTFNLMAAVVVMFIIDLVRGGKEGFLRRLRDLFIMGLTLIPSGLYMIWLHFGEFTAATEAGEEHHVIFGLTPLLTYEHLGAAILFGMTFPIVVWLFNTKKAADPKYRFALYIFLMGVLQWAFITESGKRGNYGNFGWGRVYGTYFLTLVSSVLFMENCYDISRTEGKEKIKNIICCVVAGLVMLAAIASQLNYFKLIATGHGYMH